MKTSQTLLLAALLTSSTFASAQTSPASEALANETPHQFVPFRMSDIGQKLPDITWGLDAAWRSEGNIRRGVNFAGKELIDLVRISFQTTAAVGDDLELSAAQKTALNDRIRLAKLSGSVNVNLNSDQEAGVDTWYHNSNSASDPATYAARWVNLIAATKKYAEARGLKVVSVSPFNEPDYTDWKQGSKEEMRLICKLLRERDDMQGVLICGGNTLNDDLALEWYNYCKAYLDEGNTHQLAGSFDNFAKFYQAVAADGKVGVGDELHNTMECMVGSEYGLTKGIWWGTCDHTRSQFMKASRGTRMGYSEDRGRWTAAAVYRHPDGHVQGFGGTSERQANTTAYAFAALDHDVFYNGQGPTRDYLMTLPGGTAYQKGQTNAETLVNIQDGDDIMPPMPTQATTYKLVNRASGLVLAAAGGSGLNIIQARNSTIGTTSQGQQWIFRPIGERSGGDFSYYKIMNARDTTLLIDVRDWSLSDKGSLIAYKGGVGDNEQWFLEYAEDGWFYIRSRHSALCIEVTPGNEKQQTLVGRALCQGVKDGSAIQQWRLLPPDVVYDTEAPAPPANLTASAQANSIRLNWTASEEADLDHYVVLRSTDGQTWNTIHNSVRTTDFVDNTAEETTTYYYKVHAMDTSLNRSADSDVVSAAARDEKALICHITTDSLTDVTGNGNHATLRGTPTHVEGKVDSALVLNGSQQFLRLPATIANSDELTISLWVYWRGGNQWQRIFDFGTDTNHYVFLTTNAGGNGPRLAIKNGGSEQIISLGSTFTTNRWRHIAVTFADDAITVYQDGRQTARNTNINIRPRDFRPIFNYIGRSQFVADPTFRGYIDEVQIYNYALSAEDVTRLYNLETVGIHEIKLTDPAQPTDGNDSQTTDGQTYDLSGRHIAAPALLPKGIYIVNGKKVVR